MPLNVVSKRGQCGHPVLMSDGHVICYTCRTNPSRQVRILHPCQVDFNTGLDGGTEGCDVCSAASDEVKSSWIPKRTYAGFWDLFDYFIIYLLSLHHRRNCKLNS